MSKRKINMVSQLSKVSPVTPSFDYIKDVYEPCLEQYLKNPQNLPNALNSINNGRKILEFNEEVDTYIAFYGAQHYYKLVEAFDALNMSTFCDRELEIFSYGCGAATDICSLISYCCSKQINLYLEKITLIEPSEVALERGVSYIKPALSFQKLNTIYINKIYRTIIHLKANDIYSNPEALKLHIFSNILDIETIDLKTLSSLIQNTQLGTNYFICISPKKYNGRKRIDAFYQEMSRIFNLLHISTKDVDLERKIWLI
jgi:hypothetical protein